MTHASVPAVSVIMPCFNGARFIAGTLENLLSQRLQDLEVVVVDDGSTDDSFAIASRFDERVRVFRQPNLGLSAARNVALGHARGRHVQFLDVDDLLESDKLFTHCAWLDTHPETDLVYGGAQAFHGPDHCSPAQITRQSGLEYIARRAGEAGTIFDRLLEENVLAVNAVMARRDFLARVGPFDETLAGNEDWEYWLRCAMSGGRFDFVNAPATDALVRMRAGSVSTNRSLMFQTRFELRLRLASELSDRTARMRNLNRAIWEFKDAGWGGMKQIRSALALAGRMRCAGEIMPVLRGVAQGLGVA